MRIVIDVPADLQKNVLTYLLKAGITFEEVPTVATAPAAPAAKPGRKSSGLPKGQRHFKCSACTTIWTGPSKGGEKARWAESGLLCTPCMESGVVSTVDRESTTFKTIMAEVEADLGDALASDIEWADDMPL